MFTFIVIASCVTFFYRCHIKSNNLGLSRCKNSLACLNRYIIINKMKYLKLENKQNLFGFI